MKSHRIIYILIEAIDMRKNLYINDIVGQFVEPNRGADEEPKEVLPVKLCQLLIFFNRMYKSCHCFGVRPTIFS